MKGIRFILSEARNPYNIGACIRALANFGFSSIALSGVFENDFREARLAWLAEAEVSAVDSSFILDKVSFCNSLSEASSGCDILFGTSSLHRQKPERDVIMLSDLPVFLSEGGYESPGIIFGCEKHGLTKEQLSHCNYIVNIPTDSRQPSINLGQAVAIVAYELARSKMTRPVRSRDNYIAVPEEIDRFALQLQKALIEKDGPHWKENARLRLIRQALLDARMSAAAVNALKSLLC